MPSAPKRAEEVQRPAHVLQQEPNRQQIEEHAERAPDAVVALAALAVHVLDRNLADRRAIPARQRRNEPVHLAIQRNVLDHFMPIRLERRAEVVNVHARKLRHQPVRAARRNPPHHEVVDALLAPARHHVVALFELFQEVRESRSDRAADRRPSPG